MGQLATSALVKYYGESSNHSTFDKIGNFLLTTGSLSIFWYSANNMMASECLAFPTRTVCKVRSFMNSSLLSITSVAMLAMLGKMTWD